MVMTVRYLELLKLDRVGVVCYFGLRHCCFFEARSLARRCGSTAYSTCQDITIRYLILIRYAKMSRVLQLGRPNNLDGTIGPGRVGFQSFQSAQWQFIMF